MGWTVASVGVTDRDAWILSSLTEVVKVAIDSKPNLASSTFLRLLSGGFPCFLLRFGRHREDGKEVLIDKQCKGAVQPADVRGESKSN